MDDTESTRYKQCSKCGALLPLSCFYKNKSTKDGYACWCSDCYKHHYQHNKDKIIEQHKEYVDKNKEQVKECKHKNYENNKDKIKERIKCYSQTDNGKEVHKRSNDKWIRKNIKKHNAHIEVYKAIRSGVLSPGPCEVCGRSERVHAHHCDYDKPLDVMWLCPICHRAWHNEHGEGANAHDEVVSDG
ncbi:hypothetical protein [Escherichia coli]|uniref:hypothetical protein n=1 Tax=Escherichia coli TaxID=562 RepID=UPI001BFCB9A3|nr:hypothetical protein [Escherichia coli]MEA0049763.1 hypothetical protein [Escherichia coli]